MKGALRDLSLFLALVGKATRLTRAFQLSLERIFEKERGQGKGEATLSAELFHALNISQKEGLCLVETTKQPRQECERISFADRRVELDLVTQRHGFHPLNITKREIDSNPVRRQGRDPFGSSNGGSGYAFRHLSYPALSLADYLSSGGRYV
jgi:hypothetical protein